MANVAPGIITFGLGGNHTSMIIGFPFNLGFFEGQIIIPPSKGPGAVGARPYIPRYDLDDPEEYPPEQKIEITVKVRVGQVWHERKYWVLPKSIGIVVKVFNMINTTLSRLKLAVSNVQNKMKSIRTTISNIGKKGDDE